MITISGRKLWPYLWLAGIFIFVIMILLLRDMDLGFVGDSLTFEYFYERLGTRETMRWLTVDIWHRHLLGSLFSAGVHSLFPGQSAAWYTLTVATHFFNGIVAFWLADAVLEGKKRWVTFAAVLVFVFSSLQMGELFAFPTGGARHIAFALALISVGLNLYYKRTANHWWHEISIALYALAVAMYEQTAYFLLLHPVIAFFEDRRNGTFSGWWRWLIQIVLDGFWYVAFVAVYLFLLIVLFPVTASERTSFSLERIWNQFLGTFALEYAPGGWLERIAPTLQAGWLPLTLVFAAAVFVMIWLYRRHSAEAVDNRLWQLIVLGAVMSLMSIASVAAIDWSSLVYSPRLIYPSALGFAFLLTAGLALLLSRLPITRTVQSGVFALVVAVLVGTGITRLLQTQQQYLERELVRRDVMNAVYQAVPAWEGDTAPYFLILPDEEYYDEIITGLNARDANFSMMFERLYGDYDVDADIVYFDAPEAMLPAPDVAAERYVGAYIIADEQGIWSPLRPFTPWEYTPADPFRLIVLAYEHDTKTATILDEVPQDVLERSNLVARVPVEWRTNYALLGER